MPRVMVTYSLAQPSVDLVRRITARLAANFDRVKDFGMGREEEEFAPPSPPLVDDKTGLTSADLAYLVTLLKMPLAGTPGAPLSAPKLTSVTLEHILNHAARAGCTEQAVAYTTAAVRTNRNAQRRYAAAVLKRSGKPEALRRYVNNSRVLDLLITLGAERVNAKLGEQEGAKQQAQGTAAAARNVPTNHGRSKTSDGPRPARQSAKSH